jgi:hypothetical protein
MMFAFIGNWSSARLDIECGAIFAQAQSLNVKLTARQDRLQSLYHEMERIGIDGCRGWQINQLLGGEVSFCLLCRTGRDQANANSVERGLRAALHAQLREDSAHVGLDGLLRVIQGAGDLLVGEALGQQA